MSYKATVLSSWLMISTAPSYYSRGPGIIGTFVFLYLLFDHEFCPDRIADTHGFDKTQVLQAVVG